MGHSRKRFGHSWKSFVHLHFFFFSFFSRSQIVGIQRIRLIDAILPSPFSVQLHKSQIVPIRQGIRGL
jgi:hypothetical protein